MGAEAIDVLCVSRGFLAAVIDIAVRIRRFGLGGPKSDVGVDCVCGPWVEAGREVRVHT
jgi:hypothetical protein